MEIICYEAPQLHEKLRAKETRLQLSQVSMEAPPETEIVKSAVDKQEACVVVVGTLELLIPFLYFAE